MISLYTIKRHNLIDRILKIIIDDIANDADDCKFDDDCVIKTKELDRIHLEFDGKICFITLEPRTKKIRLFKHIIEIDISVSMLGEIYRSTISLLDLNNAFTRLGFKLNKSKLENLLDNELTFLYFRIQDIVELVLNKIKGVEEMEEKVETVVTDCCKKEVSVDEAILNHGMCDTCMDKGVEESNQRASLKILNEGTLLL